MVVTVDGVGLTIGFIGFLLSYTSVSQTVGRDPQGGEGLESGAQHTFPEIKNKTALNQLEK
jgi:hypothetical protein